MRKYLVFDCINQDSLRFERGQIIPAGASFELFTDNDFETEDKVTKASEEEILKWLMSSRGGSLLLEKLRLSHALCGFSVRQPVVENPHHSDIDLILCEPEFPEFSIGIQCKRVKIDSLNET